MCHRIFECGLLTGTRSAEGIMASGHVNRANRPNTWPHRPAAEVKKALANGEPSTHGTTRTSRDVRSCATIGDIAHIAPLPCEPRDFVLQ
jgi:hypothetical protein